MFSFIKAIEMGQKSYRDGTNRVWTNKEEAYQFVNHYFMKK
jgi:hypothetical protein